MRGLAEIIITIITAMISYTMQGNIVWAILCGIFWPISWAVWLINHTVTMSVIKQTFTWFFV